MTNILVHGLGQTEQSWDKVIEELNKSNIEVSNPNLFNLAKNYQINYENIYRTFADYCDSFKDKINLCGLSLGGILAIDYAIEHPEKINSIVLIGTPYDVTKKMLKLSELSLSTDNKDAIILYEKVGFYFDSSIMKLEL